MRKFNFKTLSVLALSALMLSGCASIKKMKKNADLIKWDVTPEVLETHAGQVKVAVDGQIPEKYFVKKATVEITPVMKFEGGEKAYPAIKLQGEKVKSNNAVISFTEGGGFKLQGSLPYEEAMKMSQLEARIVASKGASSLDFEPIKIADGVIATSELVMKNGMAIIGVQREPNTTGKYNPEIDAFQRVVPDAFAADIHYLINSAILQKEEIKSEDVAAFNAYAKDAVANDRKELKNLEISAYASPDGSLDLNTKLAQDREATTKKFVTDSVKLAQVSDRLRTRYTAEDWDGFKDALSKSNVQDKELILRVLSMYSDPEVREKEIRNLSEAFTAVANDILPQLRRAKLSAEINLIGKTDEELLAAAENDPKSLNQAELLHAATLTTDLAKKLQFYNSFIKQFENDWRGYNNLGMTYVMMYDYEKAAPNFEKADKLSSSNPIIQNNLGIIALKNGETEKARQLFTAAAATGDKAVDYNMGIVSILRAEYDKAVKYFGETPGPNSGLARILNGDNNGAVKALEACTNEECAMVDYLMAVVGARTAKENMVVENLNSAIKKDPKLKAAAKTDMEFAKYFESAAFKAVVQ